MVSDQRLIEAVSKYGRRCYKIRFRRYQASIPVSTPHDLARLHATYWPEIWGDICDKYARKAGSWLFENEPHLQEATFRASQPASSHLTSPPLPGPNSPPNNHALNRRRQ